MNQFEGVFDPIDVSTRRLRNGNLIRVTMEMPFDQVRLEELVKLQYKRAKVLLVEEEPVEVDEDEEFEDESDPDLFSEEAGA